MQQGQWLLTLGLPKKFLIKIIASTIKFVHCAIVMTSLRPAVNYNKRKIKVSFRRRSPQQHATMLWGLKEADFEAIYTADISQTAWEIFYSVATERLNHMYPNRIVTLISSDPFT